VRLIAHRRLRKKLKRLEQEHTLEKERVRIARDLHDELGAGLTEVGMMAERIVTTSSDKTGGALTDLAWRTRRLSTELSGIVWALNSRNSTLNRLADFVRQYTQRLFKGLSINCVIKNGDHLPVLPVAPDVQHHLIAATKEALNNVLKHSQATEVSVELHYQNDWFEIVIGDNGQGFVVNEARELDGNGLRNIHSRIAEIGGDVAISSEPGKGTQVMLRVKLPKPVSQN
jgi:signal transduction histidine kinase